MCILGENPWILGGPQAGFLVNSQCYILHHTSSSFYELYPSYCFYRCCCCCCCCSELACFKSYHLGAWITPFITSYNSYTYLSRNLIPLLHQISSFELYVCTWTLLILMHLNNAFYPCWAIVRHRWAASTCRILNFLHCSGSLLVAFLFLECGVGLHSATSSLQRSK